MNLPVIQSLWIDGALSRMERLAVQSFIDNGHEFHLYTYGKVGNVPSATVIRDGNDILPKGKIFTNQHSNSLGPFSDWFRYALLAANGGFWVDMDIICLKPFDFEPDIVFADTPNGGFHTAVLKFPAKHPCMLWLSDYCASIPEPENTPHFHFFHQLTVAINRFQLGRYALPATTFYPLEVNPYQHLFGGGNSKNAENPHSFGNAYAIHLVNSGVRELLNSYGKGYDKNSLFPDDSFYEQLNRKHAVDAVSEAATCSDEDMRKLKIQSFAIDKDRRKRRERKKRAVALVAGLAVGFAAAWLIH